MKEVLIAQQLVDMAKRLEQEHPNPTNLELFMAMNDFKYKYKDWDEIKEKVFAIAKNLYNKQY